VNKLIARGAGAVAAAAVAASAAAMVGAATAHAQSPVNRTYEEARSIVQRWGAQPVLATVTGSVLPLDQCIVTSFGEQVSVSAVGVNTGRKVLLNVNCNAKVAQPGTPGNSLMTPQGKQAKRDIRVANIINKDPTPCYASDDDLAYCKRVCNRTGMCDADAL